MACGPCYWRAGGVHQEGVRAVEQLQSESDVVTLWRAVQAARVAEDAEDVEDVEDVEDAEDVQRHMRGHGLRTGAGARASTERDGATEALPRTDA